jgi:hypothetical protein
LTREKKKREEDIHERGGEENRNKERYVDVFYKRKRINRRRRDLLIVK